MERADGFMFDCRIPPFSLESKQDDPTTSGGDPNGPTIIGNWFLLSLELNDQQEPHQGQGKIVLTS